VRRLLLLICLLLPGLSQANLYEGKTQVESQSSNQRKKAATLAMQQVLIKVSGQQDIVENVMVRSRLRQAESFIRQFSFRHQQKHLFYVAEFEAKKIDQLIRSAGFPIWSNRRPVTLAWLAKEDDKGFARHLITESLDSNIKQQVQTVAQERGIEIVFPLMDLDDSRQIGVDDVWGRFEDTIKLASERYPVEAVLSARLYRIDKQQVVLEAEGDTLDARAEADNGVVAEQNTNWRLEWNFNQQGESFYYSLEQQQYQPLITELIHWVANQLAEKFAVESDNSNSIQEPVLLNIVNLGSLSDYVGLQRFFESLTAVSKAELLSVKGQQAGFALYLLGNQLDLINELQLDNRIKRDVDEFGQAKISLDFVWTP